MGPISRSSSMLEMNEIAEVRALNDYLCNEKEASASSDTTVCTEEDYWDSAPSMDDGFGEGEGTIGAEFSIPLSDDPDEKDPSSEDDKICKSLRSSLRRSASTPSLSAGPTPVDGAVQSQQQIVRRKSSLKKNSSLCSITELEPSTPTLSSENSKMKRNVSFTSLDVREYDMTLGDHPNVSYGPPVTLSWEYSQYDSICLDEYEAIRGRRRKKQNMRLSYIHRKDMLKQAGFTSDDIKEATKTAKRVQAKRNATKTFLPYYHVEKGIESAGRKMKRVLSGGNLKI